MIDNFELIKPLFYFNEANNMFFHCQIVQRAKDHKGQKVKEGAIKTYFIRSREHLESLKKEIILLCEHYGARAYINVSGKDFDKVQKLMLVKLANDIHLDNIRNPRKCLNSAAGECKSRMSLWVVDVDDMSLKESILKWLDEYNNRDRETPAKRYLYVRSEIPTVQGCHLITIPFNLKEFHEVFPGVDVHKNSMGTLLYYPDMLSRSKYCCSMCGSTNIQIQAWINANTNEYIDDIGGDECWCKDCGNHTKLKEIK